MCGSSSVPPPPALDATAQEIEKMQLEALQQQQAMTPVLAKEYGYAENPNYTSIQPQIQSLETARQAWLTSGSPTGENRAFTSDERQQNAANIQVQIDTLKANNPMYQKTPERIAQDKATQELQTVQMDTAKKANDALNTYLDSLNTDDYKAYQAAQQELQAQQTKIALQQGERTQQALEGKLPLSQGTIDRKAQDFQLLKENLARGGNSIIGDDPSSAYSLSSPGVQALKEFNTRYSGIEDAERRGTLDSGTQAYLQAVGLSGNIGSSTLNTTGQLSNPGGYAATSTSLAPMGSPLQNNASLIQGYSSALNPYLSQQQMGWQTGAYNAGIDAQDRAGWMQLGGTVLGAAASAAITKSNRRFKKNIEPISSEKDATLALAETPVYRWNYKDEPDGHKRHLGTMTDEAPVDVVTEDGDYLDVTSYLGLLTLSTKDLHDRVLSLEGARS